MRSAGDSGYGTPHAEDKFPDLISHMCRFNNINTVDTCLHFVKDEPLCNKPCKRVESDNDS